MFLVSIPSRLQASVRLLLTLSPFPAVRLQYWGPSVSFPKVLKYMNLRLFSWSEGREVFLFSLLPHGPHNRPSDWRLFLALPH